jgi:hypothetical protein
MRPMNSYETAVFEWFVKTANTLEKAEELCEKHYGTKDVDILDVYKVIAMYEKEKK